METLFIIYIVGVVCWGVFFLIGIFVNSDDRELIKLPIRGLFMTPVWPLAIAGVILLGFVRLWNMADWNELTKGKG